MTFRGMPSFRILLALAAGLPPAGAVAQDAAAPPVANAAAAELPRIVVSARKREEGLLEVPAAVTVFGEEALGDYNIRSFADYANKVPNLSFAYGNGASAGETGTGVANARTIAIRGIAGGRTTAYYVDDTPLPGAVDVRVLDLRAIEILKGPQGTLFGESSLGGNVRLISKPPSLTRGELRYMVEGGTTPGAGGGHSGAASAVANVVLAPGRAALRMVAFAERDAGYLTRTYLSDIANPASARIAVGNQAARRGAGGSLSLLLRLSDDADLTLRLMAQDQRYHGFPATYAPLPAFEPLDTIAHTANIQPAASEHWTLPSLVLRYRGEGWSLHSSSSYFQRRTMDLEDSTEGTAQYLASYGLGTPPAQPFAWTAHRAQQQFAHETRFSINPGGRLGATAGVYYASFRGQRDSDPLYGRDVLGVPGRSLLWAYTDDNNRKDASLFGELYYAFLDHFTLTAGNRKYWLRQDDHARFDGALYGVHFVSDTANRASGNNPKLALAYQPDPAKMAYVSASKGFRAGGSQSNLAPLLGGCVSAADAERLARIEPDTVWSYELGGKLELPEPGLVATGALYHIDWKNIQQPAFVPACAFYLQGNAGAAKIDGAEFELAGRLTRALKLRLGLGYEHARITEQGASQQPAGSRIKQIPAWTATLGAVYSEPLTALLTGFAAADYSYAGSSISSNSTALELKRPGYGLLNLRVGVSWEGSELSLSAANLANARPNLGDVGYLGYQRFEVDGKTPLPQVVTLPPRRFALQYRHRF